MIRQHCGVDQSNPLEVTILWDALVPFLGHGCTSIDETKFPFAVFIKSLICLTGSKHNGCFELPKSYVKFVNELLLFSCSVTYIAILLGIDISRYDLPCDICITMFNLK